MDEDSHHFRYAMDSAIYSALLATRWSPNNLIAWACLIGFSDRKHDVDLALDIFLMLHFQFMLMEKILKEKEGTAIWYATHQILEWHKHPAIKRFYLEAAFRFGLANDIPLYFKGVIEK